MFNWKVWLGIFALVIIDRFLFFHFDYWLWQVTPAWLIREYYDYDVVILPFLGSITIVAIVKAFIPKSWFEKFPEPEPQLIEEAEGEESSDVNKAEQDAQTPEKKEEPKEYSQEELLGIARQIVRNHWRAIEALSQGDDQKMADIGYTQAAINIYRKDILHYGETVAFLQSLANETVAINKEIRRYVAGGLYEQGAESFKKRFFMNLSPLMNEALMLESKSGDWGDALCNAQEADNSQVLLGLNKQGEPVYHSGEGHLITIAPTGAGKGQCHILPNLYDYNGSVFVLDVKGENERLTGLHRGWYGNRFTFAPYAKESDSYNPLDFVETWSECREMADWLMVPSGVPNRDDYFHNRGKEFLSAFLFHTITFMPANKRHMRKVCRLVWSPKEGLDQAWQQMDASEHEVLQESAADMKSTFENAPKEFSGIINSIKASLEIWREPEVANVTKKTEDGWHPACLRNDPAIKESIVRQGGTEGMSESKVEELKSRLGMSIYLNVPVGKISQMASLLRVFIGQHIKAIIKASDDDLMGYNQGGDMYNLPTAPVMFMLDEFPQLGFMKAIEETLEIGRSYKIRLWLFAQDMGQLARHYPNPKGIVANCVVQNFMNMNDNETAKYVSERLGTVRPIIGEKRPLADMPTLMGEKFKDNFVCLQRNQAPLKLQKLYAYKFERFKNYMDHASLTPDQRIEKTMQQFEGDKLIKDKSESTSDDDQDKTKEPAE